MAAGKLMVFTKPVSPDMDAEFNRWYDGFHVPEVCKMLGAKLAERYRLKSAQPNRSRQYEEPYVAVYHFDDIDEALSKMGQMSGWTQSDTIDAGAAVIHVYEPILVYEPKG